MIIQFGIYNGKYVTLESLKYKDIEVPSGFEFDGVTVKAPFTLLFSNKDLRQGIRASCFHDWMCRHKDEYTREYSTKVLVDIWQADGLDKIKAKIAGFAVDLYQMIQGGWMKS